MTGDVRVVPIDGKRFEVYGAQNRSDYLTPRQVRRIKHKHNHALAPFGKKAEK